MVDQGNNALAKLGKERTLSYSEMLRSNGGCGFVAGISLRVGELCGEKLQSGHQCNMDKTEQYCINRGGIMSQTKGQWGVRGRCCGYMKLCKCSLSLSILRHGSHQGEMMAQLHKVYYLIMILLFRNLHTPFNTSLFGVPSC